MSHLQAVVMVDMMLGDYAAMQRHIDEAEKLEPSAGRSLKKFVVRSRCRWTKGLPLRRHLFVHCFFRGWLLPPRARR